MNNLPTDTVTFLFTDIEGSTQLLHALRDQYALVLVDQRAILRAAFDQWAGREIDTQDDAFFVAFARAARGMLPFRGRCREAKPLDARPQVLVNAPGQNVPY